MGFLITQWLILAGSLAVSAALIDGFDIHGGLADLLVLAIGFGVIGAISRWIVWLVTLPIRVVALSLTYLTDALCVLVIGHLSPTLHVAGVWPAIVATIVISTVSTILITLVHGPSEAFTRPSSSGAAVKTR